MSVDLESEVKALREEVHELKHQVVTDFMNHIKEQQKQLSSRRGECGSRGEKGESVVGPAGRDAVLIVKTDTKENVVHVFDESGNEKATIVPVAGPSGRDGVSPPPARDGFNGKDGVSPNLKDVVALVLHELKAHWAKL